MLSDKSHNLVITMKIELAPNRNLKKIFALSAFVLLLGYAGYAVSSKANKAIPLSQLSFEQVKQSDLDIYTNAYGEFASAKERLLTAPAQGKVAEILIRPGTLLNTHNQQNCLHLS